MMSSFISILFSTLFISFSFSSGHASETVPVYYWQLLDEDRYFYLSDMDQLDWREIRKKRQLRTTANQEFKLLELKVLGPENSIETSQHPDRNPIMSATTVMRDPNGVIHELSGLSDENSLIKIPHDENLIGRYLLGAHIMLGERDVDGDGIPESVHLCAKHLVVHRKDGGKMGSASVVFFDDVRRMPFEIGPVIDTAKSKYGGGTQSPHRSYEMMVRYLNKPLPGAEVTVITESSQWQKTYVTDENGKFEIMPTDDRFVDADWQKYLFVATHHDHENKTCYVTTLPVMVYKNRPEWRSKAMGFTYWSIVGSGFGLLTVLGFVRRKRRQDSRAMIIFENHKIKKDGP